MTQRNKFKKLRDFLQNAALAGFCDGFPPDMRSSSEALQPMILSAQRCQASDVLRICHTSCTHQFIKNRNAGCIPLTSPAGQIFLSGSVHLRTKIRSSLSSCRKCLNVCAHNITLSDVWNHRAFYKASIYARLPDMQKLIVQKLRNQNISISFYTYRIRAGRRQRPPCVFTF
jgi:hypothetical protein